MKHIDLFSGIGGFAIAIDSVFDNVRHSFCDIDPFCQQVLKKRYPNAKIHTDIRSITSNSDIFGHIHGESKIESTERQYEAQCELISSPESPFILTGGFPCQPFSQAGKRKGTDDNRHLWPEMLRVIQLSQPTWVIAENVRGILTIEGGLVFEQVCLDLEASGYEVQPFIIPAVAVNAPHRRDRVWFVANRSSERSNTGECDGKERQVLSDENRNATEDKSEREGWECGAVEIGSNASDSESEGLQRHRYEPERNEQTLSERSRNSWEQPWLKVATELCGVDDGLSVKLDGFELSKSRNRTERLKSLGNAIVPQVAIEILKSIKNAP